MISFSMKLFVDKCFREVCAPSNCEFRPAEKVISPQPRTNHFQIIWNCNDCFQVCRDDEQELIQNIPTEDCSLEPQEDCRMETVLVPRLVLTFKKSWSWSSWLIFWYILTIVRLVLKPNCIKVPKEICVEAKVNPRKVSSLFVPIKMKLDVWWWRSGEEAGDPRMVLQAFRPPLTIVSGRNLSDSRKS